MKVRYTVHSAVVEPIDQVVTLANGQKARALVEGLTVELLEVDGGHTLTRRYVPDDMAAARAMFTVGAAIDGEFSAAAAAPEATED